MAVLEGIKKIAWKGGMEGVGVKLEMGGAEEIKSYLWFGW